MGAWGTGLYSSDAALDLRATVAAVVRLPFEVSRVVEILVGAFPTAANDRSDEEHTTFWLVLADQLHRRGIDVPAVFARAQEIIDSGEDLRVAQDLGMDAPSLRKREKALQRLRSTLGGPLPLKRRQVLKSPQPLLMATGDVVVFPIDERGECINPYFSQFEFKRSAWGAAVIVASGHAFDYLAYYCPLVTTNRVTSDERPSFESLRDHRGWRFEVSGTCSKTHFQRMRLEQVGSIRIDPTRVEADDGTFAAINDISLANCFDVRKGAKYDPDLTIERIDQITR